MSGIAVRILGDGSYVPMHLHSAERGPLLLHRDDVALLGSFTMYGRVCVQYGLSLIHI